MKNYLFILLFAIAYQTGFSQTRLSPNPKLDSQNLIPIDFNDSKLNGWKVWLKDTTLKSGWQIKYLVKDDSTKYRDLFIQWAKGEKRGVCKYGSVLEGNGASIPFIFGENSSFIFLTHACGSTCSALLIFTKENPQSYSDYLDVVDFNMICNQLLYIKATSYKDTFLEVSLVDLNKGKEFPIRFNHRCTSSFKSSYIDTVIFNFDKTIIKAKFDDTLNSTIKEQRIIDLK